MSFMNYILILIILNLSGSFGRNFTCIPNEDCHLETATGNLVPDPTNCNQYYVCLGEPPFMYPSSGPLVCPGGGHFDYDTQTCVSGSECENDCEIPPNICKLGCKSQNFFGDPNDCSIYHICKPDGTYTNATCSVSPNYYFNGTVCQDNPTNCCDYCTPYCEEKDVVSQIPDPHDCYSFYICLEVGFAGEESHTVCPSGQYFDSSLLVCVAGDACNDLCTND